MCTTALLLFFCVGIINAHICAIFPEQRGPLSVSTPGDPSCYRRTPYCGGIPFTGKKTSFLAGETVTLLFQQNLNHWYPPNPGFLDVSFSSTPDNDSSWIILTQFDDYPAHDMVVQTNFTAHLTLPSTPVSHAVLRFRYQSNNPLEKDKDTTIFYNCADIELVGSGGEKRALKSASLLGAFHVTEKKENEKKAKAPSACLSPNSWEVEGIETNSLGTVSHRILYDFNTKFVRWERVGNLEPGKGLGHLLLITNYTSGAEYVIDPTKASCETYGGDAMYQWGYGSGMNLDNTYKIGGAVVDAWYNPTNGFRWLSFQKDCVPYIHYIGTSTNVFFNHKVGPVPQSAFLPPSYCK